MGSAQRVPPPLSRRVFVSSTSLDLHEHRDRVRDTLGRMEQFPVIMEQFGAQGEGDATSVSLEKLRTADVYIGLVAWRYGYVPPGETRSVTHLEYEEATRLGLPRYLFLAHNSTDAPDDADALFPATVRDANQRDQLNAFRAELGAQVVDFFTTPDDLARKVATAMHGYLLREYWEQFLREAGHRTPRILPPRPAGFVGRSRELGILARLLRHEQASGVAVAISGMAGVGKSALAGEMIHRLAGGRDAFPAGITWVRCERRRGADGLTWIYEQILGAWGAPVIVGAREAAALEAGGEVELREHALERLLTTRFSVADSPASALLLLDNAEHDLPLSRALETLLPLGVTVLVTSRHQPGVLQISLVPLDVLEPEPAAALFVERFAARGGTLSTEGEALLAAGIADLLGRHPLAIELAAARAARLGQRLQETLAEMRQADRLGKLRDPLDPTRSVRYVLETSLDVLSPVQRVAFSALGLPAGPDWSVAVVRDLLSSVSENMGITTSVDDDIDVLLAFSLITIGAAVDEVGERSTTEKGTSDRRIRVHPLLREVAAEEWRKQPVERQRSGLASLLQSAVELARANAENFATLRREEEFIADTLQRAVESHINPADICATVSAMGDYIQIGAHWHLGMQLWELALRACRALNDEHGEGMILNNLGSLALDLARLPEAEAYLRGALTIRSRIGDIKGLATTCNNLGSLTSHLGESAAAEQYYQQALELWRQLGDDESECIALDNLGILAAQLGEGSKAQDYFQRALVLARQTGNRRTEAITLNNLATQAILDGDSAEAARDLERGLEILRQVGDRRGEAGALSNLGMVASEQGKLTEAQNYFENAVRLAREIGDLYILLRALNNLGKVHQDSGQWAQAEQLYREALGFARQVGDPYDEAGILGNLLNLADRLGRDADALRYRQEMLKPVRLLGDVRQEAVLVYNIGMLYRRLGHRTDAVLHLQEAIKLFGQLGMADEAETVGKSLEQINREGL